MYNFIKCEKKWQQYWEENQIFKTDVWDFSKPKYYVLGMFSYPSAEGLHVGHPEGYTACDIMARMKRMQGYNVLNPMGFDAFGLPAEQYAIKTGNQPNEFTYQNINNYIKQLKMCGLSYDWSKSFATCDPDYYKWTQWIFKKLFEDGYAKYQDTTVNWCEELGTVLANDEIIDGKSERGGYPVTKKKMKQWVLKISDYAEALLKGLDEIDWPVSTKEIQKNWIGKSIGATITFKVSESDKSFDVFTTRPDTLFGATYCVLSPEHPLLNEITTNEQREEIKNYQHKCSLKSDLERTELNKEKTGVFTGSYAINPVNNKKIPIWISDYVLVSYGTGAIMAVPAHDERDYEFAKKFKIDIIPVLEGGDINKSAFTQDGLHINSDFLNGLNKEKAITKIIEYLTETNQGYQSVNYKMRDWIFARQRYWGEPVPVIHFNDDIITLKENELPLILPPIDDYNPSKEGLSPLTKATEWVNVNVNGQKGKRETSTMPSSAGSSWYFLRYIDPTNQKAIGDPKLLKHWLPVDLYIGGVEHATGHLLYSRFWNHYLYEKGIVPVKEPFKKLIHQGMILGANNEKMSKSKGNVINPDDIIKAYGADALRLYLMFMGPIQLEKPWSNQGLDGAKRFIDRVYRMFEIFPIVSSTSNELEKIYHQTVQKVTNDYETANFNTAISQMMILVNSFYKEKQINKSFAEGLIKMLNPIAPFVTEEIWNKFLGNENTITYETWPEYDINKTVSDETELAIQINGKLRSTIVVRKEITPEELLTRALKDEKIKKYLENKEIVKKIVIPAKIVNIVVKEK